MLREETQNLNYNTNYEQKFDVEENYVGNRSKKLFMIKFTQIKILKISITFNSAIIYNKLYNNASKTKIMVMDNKQDDAVKLYLCNELIAQTKTIKNLGTELESNHQNIEHVAKRKKLLPFR